jgi:hypothetical protein
MLTPPHIVSWVIHFKHKALDIIQVDHGMAASCGAKDTFGASAGKQFYESDH